MREILIISGKGGTGKTTLTAALARLQKNIVVADCDVDAPDLHLLLKPEIKRTFEFKGGKEAVINKKFCNACGSCVRVCQFDAISSDFEVDPVSCEGCGVCVWNCPVNAISMNEKTAGEYFISDFSNGIMVHALLAPGEENSGKLVSQVKKVSKEQAEDNDFENILIDGAPGIGCPVIASLSGVNLALIVTESTISGKHDLERVLSLCGHFKIPAEVVINKFDINPKKAAEIENYCKEKNIKIAGKIPFAKEIYEALRNAETVVDYKPECEVSKIIKKLNETLWVS